jgi:uncharacterized membrane protein YedE/YeeE
MQSFTPLSAVAGGVLIGLASALLLLFNGRIAGVSGIFAGLVLPGVPDRGWRLAFVLGLVAAGFVLLLAYPAAFPTSTLGRSPLLIAAAGLFVGYGTRLGSGCTSGHGVCGLSRLSARSLVATLTFIGMGMATVFVLRHLAGGAR